VGGTTIRLTPIAKSLPGRHPIYGIQAKGLDGTDAPNDSVEAMTECYLSAITSVQPRGPYFLAGMCFGGLVAMEIARSLSARGETIGLLAFLDTYPHPRYWPLRFRVSYFVIRRIRESWSALRAITGLEVVRYVSIKLKALLRKFVALAGGRQAFLKAPDSLPPAIKAVFDGAVAALVNYHPRYYPGKVSYLMCGYHAYLPDGPTAIWARQIGQLEVESAPVLTDPEYVANWLFDRIQDAVGQDVRPRGAELLERTNLPT
jgi:acetoacetyl-CoA synthetase